MNFPSCFCWRSAVWTSGSERVNTSASICRSVNERAPSSAVYLLTVVLLSPLCLCCNVLIIFTICLVLIFTPRLWCVTTQIIKPSSAVAETKVRGLLILPDTKHCQIITNISLMIQREEIPSCSSFCKNMHWRKLFNQILRLKPDRSQKKTKEKWMDCWVDYFQTFLICFIPSCQA